MGGFPGKDELYREILATRSAGLVAAVNRSAEADGTAFERLSVGIREIVGYLIANRPFFQILLHEGKAWGLDPRGKAAREAWQLGRSAVAEVLQRGMETGEILAGDADLLAATVNAVLQVQLAGLLERVDEPDADDLAEQILLLLRRLLCRSAPPERAVA